MPERNIDITRRKVLASIGAVGAAGAGAGMGTSALYQDTEQIEANEIMAGDLDLKLDWEEHYSFPQVYGLGDPTVEDGDQLDVVRSDPEDDDYVALPDPEPGSEREPLVWANDNDDPLGNDGPTSLELYFQNTIIEAFPDQASTDPQGTFTAITSGDEPVVENPCSTLADLPEGLSTYNEDVDGGTLQNPGRTVNEDTYNSETNEPKPLLHLNDVKPGDFGEFTFSTHLCGNPGHLWLQMPGGLKNESENGVSEVEASSDAEDGSVGSPGSDPELAENVETTLWYDDNCNNRIDGEPQDLVALAIIDTSGSTSNNLGNIRTAANELVEQLNAAQTSETRIYAGFIIFDDQGDENDVILGSPIVNVSNYVDNNGDGIFDSSNIPNTTGNSPIPQALDVGREYLNDVAAALVDDTNVNIDDPNKQILLVSDGASTYETSGSLDKVSGTLLDSPGGDAFSFSNNNSYQSDYFDGLANDTTAKLPDPDSTGELPGTARAETALVARDIDGEPFLPGTQYEQSAGPKIDNPDNQPEGGFSGSDPADISGENDITVRAVAIYDSGASSSTKDLARDTMTAYATGAEAYYDLPMAGPTAVASTLVEDLNVETGETVLFRGTLPELATYLDPDQDGPVLLDADRSSPGTDCFAPGTTHCFGLAWWVPTSVGNEIQGDSVSFDLGFYAEQCRNNETPSGT